MLSAAVGPEATRPYNGREGTDVDDAILPFPEWAEPE
jgi:hypothetical protein